MPCPLLWLSLPEWAHRLEEQRVEAREGRRGGARGGNWQRGQGGRTGQERRCASRASWCSSMGAHSPSSLARWAGLGWACGRPPDVDPSKPERRVLFIGGTRAYLAGQTWLRWMAACSSWLGQEVQCALRVGPLQPRAAMRPLSAAPDTYFQPNTPSMHVPHTDQADPNDPSLVALPPFSATLLAHIAAIIMTIIMVMHIRSKYTAVGRKEMVFFFYLYALLELLAIFLDTAIIPFSSPVFPVGASMRASAATRSKGG